MRRLVFLSMLLWTLGQGCTGETVSRDAASLDAAPDVDLEPSDGPRPDADPLTGVVVLTQSPVRILRSTMAADEVGFVAVWVQVQGVKTDRELWFARLDPSGAVTTKPTMLLSDLGKMPNRMQLVATQHGLTLWYSVTNDGHVGKVYALVFKADGKVIQGPIKIDDLYSYRKDYGVAYDGTRFLVLTERLLEVTSGTKRQRVHRLWVDWESGKLDPEPSVALIDTGTSAQHCGDLAWFPPTAGDPGRYIAVYEEPDDLVVATLDDQAKVLFTHELSISSAELKQPRVTSVGPDKALLRMVDSIYVRSPLVLPWSVGKANGSLWTAPTTVYAKNRAESTNTSTAGHNGQALVVWESDATTMVPEIRAGWLDVPDATEDPKSLHGETRVGPETSLRFNKPVAAVYPASATFAVLTWAETAQGDKLCFFPVTPP